jgi:subtilisin family serine protease
MSLFVTATQLDRLVGDPDVISIQEDIPSRPALADSTLIIHADELVAAGHDGLGWKIAILDTGVDKTHPMLTGKVASEACYSTNSGANIKSVCPGGVTQSIAAGSGVNCPAAVKGCDHGTHVASIAAGRDTGELVGVAFQARLISIQVFTRFNSAAVCNPDPAPCARYYETDLIKGLERVYALRDTHKIAAVNLSLGIGAYQNACNNAFPALTTALTNLRNVKIAPIAAAGNAGLDGKISSPACITKTIPVGNTTKTDVLAASSNHSRLVKLFAPGTAIEAAVPRGRYAKKTGTSMAAPHVAGAFAMLREAKPAATVDEILNSLTCTGKTVDRPQGQPAGVVIDDPRPRIEVFGAYDKLLRPAGTQRSWTFSSALEGLDWTPLRGTWSVAGGVFRPAPIAGVVATAHADCHNARDITVRQRRVIADPYYSWLGSGIFVNAEVDYTFGEVSGYQLNYYFATDNDEWYVQTTVHWTYRYNVDTDTSQGGDMLCAQYFTSGFNRNGFNDLRVVTRGSKHNFYFNGQLICSITDTTFTQGSVVPYGFFHANDVAGVFQIDSVTIKSLAAPAVAASEQDDEDVVMDPAQFAPNAVNPKISLPPGARLPHRPSARLRLDQRSPLSCRRRYHPTVTERNSGTGKGRNLTNSVNPLVAAIAATRQVVACFSSGTVGSALRAIRTHTGGLHDTHDCVRRDCRGADVAWRA